MIDILMATYNGEKYIKEQLDSILNQSNQDFRILIRDDGSQDRTIEIINQYVNTYPDKIFFIVDNAKCGSAASNFMQLTKYATSDYVMYCDQDDVWLKNKIEVTLNKMDEIENKIGSDKPILVFSTYQPVNANLKAIPHKEKSSQIGVYNLSLNRLLVQNYVTGCLTMCNKALYSMAGDYSNEILMHDWWLALIASAMGEICHIQDITMLYRQHANNVVGCVDVKSIKYIVNKVKDPKIKATKYLYKSQAELLLSRYGRMLANQQFNIVKQFIDLFEYSKPRRMIKLIIGGYLKSNFVRVIGQLRYI